MIITGSIVGALLPASSIFTQACVAQKVLIENTNESCARLCEYAILGEVQYSRVRA